MKYLSNLDLNKNELQNVRFQNLAVAPASPVNGQVYYNSVENKFYGYANGNWCDLTYKYLGENFTSILKNKLDGIATAATRVEKSSTNGNLKINGTETIVYTHQGSGTNPHGTTKGDVGLGSVENKSSATIRGELTTANISNALGFTPKKILEGVEGERPTASGSMILYIATDTKKIWLDTAANTWLQVGGQDTIAWGNITGKPIAFPPSAHNHDSHYLGKTGKAESAKVADSVAWGNVSGKPSIYTPPKASNTVLGGVKIGNNLTINEDGILSANDNPVNYIVKQEKFIAIEGQKIFDLTKGKYRPGLGTLSIFLNGVKVANTVLEEVSQTRFTLKAGLSAGDYLLAEYVELIDVTPYPIHANEHLPGGVDPILEATTSKAGLMSSSDKSKLNGVAAGANNYAHPSSHPASVIIQDANNRFVTDLEKATWSGKAAENHNHGLASLSEKSYNSLTDKPSLGTVASKNTGVASGQVPLIGSDGKLDPTIMPAIAISDTFVVNSQTAMLALTAEIGDVCVRTDLNKSFILKVAGASTLANWQELLTPADKVQSVNGMTGAVTINKSHIGLGNVDNVQQASRSEFNAHNADNTRHITAAERTTWNARTKKYAVDVGNGTLTTIPVTHNIGVMDISITIRENSSPYNVVFADIQFVDSNKFNILFGTAPASNQYRVTVVG